MQPTKWLTPNKKYMLVTSLQRLAKITKIAGDTIAILEEVQFGKYRVVAGLCMRNAMFINAIKKAQIDQLGSLVLGQI